MKRKKYAILNKKLKPKVINISSNKKIIKIENILKKPSKILNLFNQDNYKDPGANYPGSRFFCPIKLQYEIKNLLLNINEKYYKIPGNIYIYECNLSIVDFNNDELNIQNVFPHKDCLEYGNGYKKSGIALVIYLCNPNKNFSGTNFYEEKLPIYTKEFFKNENLMKIENSKLNYETDISLFLNKIYEAEIKFNKCIIYPTNYFHCANLKKIYGEKNTVKNRYTLTAFMFFDNKIKSNFPVKVDSERDNFDYLNNYYVNGYENNILNSRYKL